jgi:hypothetical protein
MDANGAEAQRGLFGKCAIDIPVPSVFETFR